MASAATIAALSSFSSLSLGRSLPLKQRALQGSAPFSLFASSKPFSVSHPIRASNDKDIDTSFFDNLDPYADIPYDPPAPPEGYVPPPSFDELPPETEEQIAAAYEELYGPAYSGVSVLGNDIYVMDAKLKKSSGGFLGRRKKEKPNDGFEERVVQVRRVTKVVKGGKKLSFRAIVVVGDKKGLVGIGVGKAKEVVDAIAKSATNARRNIVAVPMTKYSTFPHRADGDYGAAKVMLRPASPGTGVIAGGAVRIVLEMAGVANALGKQIGSKNALNNARATVVAVQKMRQFRDVARERGIPMEELWK
ncbi:hypothetical protein J5N97_011272 [Dioscorea zingiberensis]|uniref:Small ribosomal subunit protein uS5c n=1 Tax=Dioscorea zingiberensis TaxID=325984 RepID=A0A9D5D217_9LILI|nr:hypothetical protein J5N97_011272 [Dioscorea zingiberensis]